MCCRKRQKLRLSLSTLRNGFSDINCVEFFIHPLKAQLGDDVQSAEATTGRESIVDLQVLRPRCIKIKTFFTTIFFNNCPSEQLFISTTVLGWLLVQELQSVSNTEPN